LPAASQPAAQTVPPRFVCFSIVTHAMGQGTAWRRLNLRTGKSSRLLKYLHKHVSRELSGLRILIRRMVGRQ
jgi:hypothetical protein